MTVFERTLHASELVTIDGQCLRGSFERYLNGSSETLFWFEEETGRYVEGRNVVRALCPPLPQIADEAAAS